MRCGWCSNTTAIANLAGCHRLNRSEDRLHGRDAAALAEEAELADDCVGSAGGDVIARLKASERENRELRQANEILRQAAVYFALVELDRRPKS